MAVTPGCKYAGVSWSKNPWSIAESLPRMTWVLALKVEQGHQVADGGTVGREIGGTGDAFRIGEIVAAVRRQRLQSPVLLNEFQQRGVVAISVVHVPRLGERRDYAKRNARTIAEKVNGLNVAGVVK